jgi:hypothetical protein
MLRRNAAHEVLAALPDNRVNASERASLCRYLANSSGVEEKIGGLIANVQRRLDGWLVRRTDFDGEALRTEERLRNLRGRVGRLPQDDTRDINRVKAAVGETMLYSG